MDTTIKNDNLSSASVPTKELPKATQIIKNVWNFFKSNFKVLWPLYAIIGLSETVKELSNDKVIRERVSELSGVTQVLFFFGTFALILLSILATISIFKSIFDIKKGEFTGLKDSFKYSSGNFWPWVVLTVITTFSILGGFALLIIPGVFLALYLSFSIQVFIDENKTPMDSMLRSWSLIRGDGWKIVKKNIVVFVLLIIAYFLVGMLSGVITAFISDMAGEALKNATSIKVILALINIGLITMITTPTSIMAMIEIYLAQKAIKGDVAVTDELNISRKKKIVGAAVIGLVLPIAIAIVLVATK